MNGACVTIFGPKPVRGLSSEAVFALLMLLWTLVADRGGTVRPPVPQRMHRIGARADQSLVRRGRCLRSIYSPGRHWLNTL